MDWERICLFASHVGTMERLLEASIEHARTRTQFGQAIGKFQAVSHRIVDMKVQAGGRPPPHLPRGLAPGAHPDGVDGRRHDQALRQRIAGPDRRSGAVQIHGGYGYMTESEVERALRDAVGSTIYSGTSEMQRNIIARWLGL